MIQRRSTRKSLANTPINSSIVDRYYYYQLRAILKIGEAFERDGECKALVVMATGSGKTRTVIACCDQLMRSPTPFRRGALRLDRDRRSAPLRVSKIPRDLPE